MILIPYRTRGWIGDVVIHGEKKTLRTSGKYETVYGDMVRVGKPRRHVCYLRVFSVVIDSAARSIHPDDGLDRRFISLRFSR